MSDEPSEELERVELLSASRGSLDLVRPVGYSFRLARVFHAVQGNGVPYAVTREPRGEIGITLGYQYAVVHLEPGVGPTEH